MSTIATAHATSFQSLEKQALQGLVSLHCSRTTFAHPVRPRLSFPQFLSPLDFSILNRAWHTPMEECRGMWMKQRASNREKNAAQDVTVQVEKTLETTYETTHEIGATNTIPITPQRHNVFTCSTAGMLKRKRNNNQFDTVKTLKQQMSNQVNDLMGLVGKAQDVETSDIASKLKVTAHSDVKNKWTLAGDDKVKTTIAKLQAQAAIDSNERDELKRKLIDEKYLNSEMRNEMIDTNATIDETKDTIEEMKETISQFQKEKKKHLLSIQQLTLQITQKNDLRKKVQV